ncbi:hypothetical protein C0J45_10053 [Silurus meridionalis]|uniref:Uncharacterized protein n=1 Tax=Silurus meridionalis TaxID=175797 RepID=A0A8T0B7Q9_SILME|nr:hypothetical protein HF521_001961 [Silurus meridionalis]KAI5099501.1 hypothetical protein C0J45_10053 [Silurus meridionalis]
MTAMGILDLFNIVFFIGISGGNLKPNNKAGEDCHRFPHTSPLNPGRFAPAIIYSIKKNFDALKPPLRLDFIYSDHVTNRKRGAFIFTPNEQVTIFLFSLGKKKKNAARNGRNRPRIFLSIRQRRIEDEQKENNSKMTKNNFYTNGCARSWNSLSSSPR